MSSNEWSLFDESKGFVGFSGLETHSIKLNSDIIIKCIVVPHLPKRITLIYMKMWEEHHIYKLAYNMKY